MTMRTYRHFHCSNGHLGIEKTSENDQPYSSSWENVSLIGMSNLDKNKDEYNKYLCLICGAKMMIAEELPKQI